MTTVRDGMRQNATMVSPSATIREVAQKMRDSSIGVVPVCENGKLRGIITQENMINRIIAGSKKNRYRSAASLMSNDIPKISPGTNIIDAAKVMVRRTVQYMPVVQNGKLMGMLTIEDVLKESPALAVMVMTKQSDSRSRNNPELISAI